MKYPLCTRAELCITDNWAFQRGTFVILAADVEKMLEGAPEVVAMGNNLTYWSTDQSRRSDDSHTARLIMIEPIVKDKAEGLLREFEKIFATSTLGRGEHILERRISINDEGKAWDLLDRARRLLEGK